MKRLAWIPYESNTALTAKEHAVIEAEILRLFEDLHSSDPLFKKPGLPKFFCARRAAATSSGSSMVSSRFTPSSFRSSSARPSSAATTPRVPVRPGQGRQANVTEADEEDGDTEEHDEDDGQGDEELASLEAPNRGRGPGS